MQATGGNFDGTTDLGGTGGEGTVFSLARGLAPFVETLPTFGIEKARITILGTNLRGATNVTFDGTEAMFSVVSSSEIKATVPAGAKTGMVDVKTLSGTLKSNRIFKVIPQLTSFTPTSGVVGTSVRIKGTELTQTTEVTLRWSKGDVRRGGLGLGGDGGPAHGCGDWKNSHHYLWRNRDERDQFPRDTMRV